MDDELIILICKMLMFGIACLLLGMYLAHWMIWG